MSAPAPDADPLDARPSVWRERMAWSAFAVFAAEAASFASWLPRLPELKALLGLTEGTLGLILLALPAGALAVMPLTGWASTRLSPARLNLICLGWMMAAITVVGLVPVAAAAMGPERAVWLLPLVLLTVGLGSGSMGVAMNVAGAAVEGALGSPVLSRCHAMFSLGLAGGSLLAGAFVAAGAPILLHLALVNAALFAVALWAVAGLPREAVEDGDAAEGAEAAPRFAWPTGALRVPALVALGCLLAEGAALDWSPVFLATVLDAEAALVGAGVTAFALAMAAVRFAGDALTGRFGDRALVAAGAALAALGYGAVALAPGPWTALGGFVLVGLGLAPIAPVAFRLDAAASPRAPGVGVAAVSTLGYAGFLLGPALIGLTAEAVGLRASFAAVAAVLVAVLLLGRALGAGHRR